MDRIRKTFSTRSPTEELSRSQYSLVATDVTEEAVQLWLELPDEVRADSSWEIFRSKWEKEHGDEQRGITNNTILTQRLPSANSAPHLNCNGQKDDVSFFNGQSEMQGGNEKFGINDSDDSPTSKTKSKISQTWQTIKVSLLVGVWIFFTAVFLMHNEKEEVTMHSSVAPAQIKDYLIQNDRNKHSVLVKLTGPFLSEAYEKKLNISDKQNMSRMDIWLEKWVPKGPSKDPGESFDYETIEISTSWTVILENQAEDFHESETRSSALFLPFSSTNQSVLAVRMTTTADVTTPFTLSYTLDPLDETTGIIYACILLLALYALIVFEVINRTMAAVLLSTSSLAVLSIAGERPSVPEIISWLDVETLLLLFSMMVLVAILAETGVFDYYAVLTFQLARGKIWPLITMLCGVTSIVSLLLDNVTTVLLVTPVTIRLSEVMELDPIPVLLSMVIFCNLAGTATPVGDPPNIIIASNKQVVQAVRFRDLRLDFRFEIFFTFGSSLNNCTEYLHGQPVAMQRPADSITVRSSRLFVLSTNCYSVGSGSDVHVKS